MIESWQRRVGDAATLEELMAVLKAFLATLGPADIAALPMECRTGLPSDAEDLARQALRLARHRLERDDASVHRTATVFAYASQRAIQLCAYARIKSNAELERSR